VRWITALNAPIGAWSLLGTDWHDMHNVEIPRLQLAQQAG